MFFGAKADLAEVQLDGLVTWPGETGFTHHSNDHFLCLLAHMLLDSVCFALLAGTYRGASTFCATKRMHNGGIAFDVPAIVDATTRRHFRIQGREAIRLTRNTNSLDGPDRGPSLRSNAGLRIPSAETGDTRPLHVFVAPLQRRISSLVRSGSES
jgi:hypothetical protein